MIYLVICAILLALELGYFALGRRLGIVDRPNSRSSHDDVTLRGGGVVFLFGLWIYALFFGAQYLWFIIGASLIGIVSFVDDLHSLPDSARLVVQFIAMGLTFYQFGILNWHDWWAVILALIVCVGIINAYNFMDGINGITGAYSLAVLAPLAYLNAGLGFIDMDYIWVSGISVLIFLFFNFREKAKCFAGDVGSITIAFIVLFALGRLILATGNFAYIVFIAVYGADTILTICHRIRLHENLGKAHRKHAFQLMANELGIPHVLVSSLYMALQLAISFGMISIPVNGYVYLGFVIVTLGTGYLLFMKKYYHLHEEYLQSVGEKIQ